MQAMKEILSRSGCLFLMVLALASFTGMLEAILVLHLLRFDFQGYGRSWSLVRQWLERVPLEEFLKACLKIRGRKSRFPPMENPLSPNS